LAKVRLLVPVGQVAPGGELQLTPVQGSALHLPLAQPKAQPVLEGA
jgi:hypothetical protein